MNCYSSWEFYFPWLSRIRTILKFQIALLGSDIMQYSKYISVSEELAASTLRVEVSNSDALKMKPTCLFKAVCLSTRLHIQSSTPQSEHLQRWNLKSSLPKHYCMFGNGDPHVFLNIYSIILTESCCSILLLENWWSRW